MSSIPPELIEFCLQQGNLLLIKGQAGTGKTILSIEFLRVLADRKGGVYLSTRVSPKRLFRQFPDLKSLMEYVLPAKTQPIRDERQTDAFDIFDLRIGEAPALIDHLYSLADRIKEPIILVDSWDAIASKLSPESKEKIEDWLEVLITKMDATLVLVNEESKPTKMDYLADGVVTLSKTRLEERLIREIELNKLRGTRIGADKYLFTLENGRFRHFEPWRWQTIPTNKRTFPPFKEAVAVNTVSTCIHRLDDVLNGGWERGSFNLVEIGEGVADDYFALIIPAAVYYISQRGTFIGVSNGVALKHLLNTTPQLTAPINKRLHFVHVAKTPLPTNHHQMNRLHVDSSDPAKAAKVLETHFLTFQTHKNQSSDAVALGYLDATVLERELGPEVTIEMLSKEAELVKNSPNLDLVTIRDSQETFPAVRPLASTHWRIRRKNRNLLFYGVVPHTGAYVLETNLAKGYLETTITPIL
jgi:KaiC/GvpD/RAD55 family RecA-like ATPase